MKLRTGKHWNLIIDNDKACTDCDRVTSIAMQGKTEKNRRERLCKSCALKRGDVERQILTSVKALLRFVRGHLTSLIVILTLNIGLSYGIVRWSTQQSYLRNVQLITDWAYPKADQRLSRSQVETVVQAHLKNSTRPEHTLAICMAESRFMSNIVGDKYKYMIGGGQINWPVWGKKLIEARIVTVEGGQRDLFDPMVMARAISFVLDHFMALLPVNLKVPGIRLTYALTFYVGDAEGKDSMKGLADRNQPLSNNELRQLISQLSYPVEVLAYTGEILEIERHGGD